MKKHHMEHLEYLFLGWLLLGLIGFGWLRWGFEMILKDSDLPEEVVISLGEVV